MTSSSSALKDAKRITSSLRSARLQMEASVLTMEDASGLLSEDSELISQTLDIHKGELKDSLKRTKKSLGTLKLSNLKEKYGITIGLGIFTCIALWIIAKRLRIVSLVLFLMGLRKYYFETDLKGVEEVIDVNDGAVFNEQIEIDLKTQMEVLQESFGDEVYRINTDEYIKTDDVEIDDSIDSAVVGATAQKDQSDEMTDIHEEM